jgi:hypothetical protein
VFAPADASWDAFEFEHVFLAFAFAKVKDGAVFGDEEFAGAGFDVLSAEGADASFDHGYRGPPSRLASRCVSLSMRMSPSRMGPMTFRVMIFPLSRPSSTRTLTWDASPAMPVRLMISTTSQGVPSIIGHFTLVF